MELWQFYRQVWEAERALKAAVPTAWVKAGDVAFAAVRFPLKAEPGERWAERTWSHAVDIWKRPLRRGSRV